MTLRAFGETSTQAETEQHIGIGDRKQSIALGLVLANTVHPMGHRLDVIGVKA